jgi:hypothetical protein
MHLWHRRIGYGLRHWVPVNVERRRRFERGQLFGGNTTQILDLGVDPLAFVYRSSAANLKAQTFEASKID